MSTKRNLIRGLLALLAVFALVALTVPTAAAAARLSKATPADSPLRGSLTVHLYNGAVASLAGVPHAGLTLTASGGLIAAKAKSNEQGEALLITAPGAYKLHVNASGFQPVDIGVKITTYNSEMWISMTPLAITDPKPTPSCCGLTDN